MNKERFLRLLNERILILDGGMGTMIQGFNKSNERREACFSDLVADG